MNRPSSGDKPKYTGKARHGTVARYSWEVRHLPDGPCMVCKAARAKRVRDDREAKRKKSAADEAQRLIDALAVPENTGLDSDDGADCTVPPDNGLGPTVNAVLEDLNHCNRDVPFYLSLRAAALALAMELDDPKSRAAKGPLVKQLVDTIRELKGSGGGAGDSFSDFLSELSAPLVPPPVRDPSEP